MTLGAWTVSARLRTSIMKSLSQVDKALERHRMEPIDSSTELYSHRAFYDFLRAEFGRSKRHLRPVSLLMIGLDSLGVDSNIFEHPISSGILNEVACSVKKSVRDCDFVGRFGGNELAIILVETNKVDAIATANRLRRLVEETNFEQCDPSVYHNGTVTASIGVASYPLDACQQMNLVTKAEHALHEAKGTGGNLVRAAEQELSLMGSYRQKQLYFLCKRCMDIILSLLFLVIGFPLIMLIALLIKLDSPGPVVFKQRRVGLRKCLVGGKKQWGLSMFNMYKFRTMYHNLDDGFHRSFMRAFVSEQVDGGENGGIYKPIEDPQITRVGRILRKTSLDELPQMLNVLKGEMSMVGPRPNVPWEVGEYRPRHYKRFDVMPGITGLAQVRGRSRILFDRIVEYDIEYIEKQSLALDLKILLWTIPSLIFGKGAK